MFEHGKTVKGEGLEVLEERMKTMVPDENQNQAMRDCTLEDKMVGEE